MLTTKIRYTFLAFLLLLLTSGLVSLGFGLYFASSFEKRRNAVISHFNIYTLLVGGVIVISSSLWGFWGYLNPLERKSALRRFCWILVFITLSCIFLGVSVWYQTLTIHDDTGEKWRNEWTYGLRKAFQDYDPSQPCCGYTKPHDVPALSESCFEQAPLPGCQELISRYADNYLSDIYIFIFGMTFLDTFTLLAALVFFQARNDGARFHKMSLKSN